MRIVCWRCRLLQVGTATAPPGTDAKRNVGRVPCAHGWDAMTPTEFDAVTRVIEQILEAEHPLDKSELSSVLVALGWELSPNQPAPSVRLTHGTITATILVDVGHPFVQFVFAIAELGTPEFRRALETYYIDEIRQAREIAAHIVPAFSSYEMEACDGSVVESGIGLVWSECWRIDTLYLTVGVEHVDPDDMPIFVMARVRQELPGWAVGRM